MKFTFKDITNTEIYETAKVLFVTGPYNIFNNIAIDEIRDRCKPEEQTKLDKSLLGDFGIDVTAIEEAPTVSNRVDIDTFMRVINISSMSGKWFTSVDYKYMSKKQKDWLKSYMSNPTDNGRIVIYCNDFMDYRLLLKDRVITNSLSVHLIQLSFPYRDVLESVVKALFEQKGVDIEHSAIELFVMRMSSSYDEYDETIDKIIVETVPTLDGAVDPNWKYTITYQDTINAMKGIENFILDDFISKLLVPLNSDKTNGRNKIYKMLDALIEEYGADKLVSKLRYKIYDYIEFRLAINSGIIPIKVKFSVPEAKGRLEEGSKIAKLTDYTFRKMAVISSKTSLKDWVYMKMIIENIQYKYDSKSYEKVLYSLINRSVLTKSRVNNDIGVESIMELDMQYIDKQKYLEDKLMFKGTE